MLKSFCVSVCVCVCVRERERERRVEERVFLDLCFPSASQSPEGGRFNPSSFISFPALGTQQQTFELLFCTIHPPQ